MRKGDCAINNNYNYRGLLVRTTEHSSFRTNPAEEVLQPKGV